MRSFYYFLFFHFQIIYNVEYMYPVAYLNNEATILYIHQQAPTNIELFAWNTDTNRTEQILWSLFNPAGLQLLPNLSGFSFIDNGRLRIKLFQKRSPKTIDYDDPIININTLHWIDNDSCYCSMQKNNYFALFQLNNDGTMYCIKIENNKDCMYPQKIDNQLFYIERCIINDISHYRIMQCIYPTDNQSLESQLIINFYDKPIIFLHMISQEEGFVLEHEQNIHNNVQTTRFIYHHLIKQNGSWNKITLFSFAIPINLLLPSEQRIYESLLPLLPRAVNNKVYFVNCAKNDNYYLEPYFYDLVTKCIHKIAIPKKRGHYFVPMLCGKKFYCGGTKLKNQKKETESFASFLT